MLALDGDGVISVEGATAQLRRASLAAARSARTATIDRIGAEPVDQPAVEQVLRPFRPRARVLPAPPGADALDRIAALTDAGTDQGPQRGGDPRTRGCGGAHPGGHGLLGLRPAGLTCASRSTAPPAGSDGGQRPARRVAADRVPAGSGRPAGARRHRAGRRGPRLRPTNCSTACSTPAPPTPARRGAVRRQRRHRHRARARPGPPTDPRRPSARCGATVVVDDASEVPVPAGAAGYRLLRHATQPRSGGRPGHGPPASPPPRCWPSSTPTACPSRDGSKPCSATSRTSGWRWWRPGCATCPDLAPSPATRPPAAPSTSARSRPGWRPPPASPTCPRRRWSCGPPRSTAWAASTRRCGWARTSTSCGGW